jgi:hypothetical protein
MQTKGKPLAFCAQRRWGVPVHRKCRLIDILVMRANSVTPSSLCIKVHAEASVSNEFTLHAMYSVDKQKHLYQTTMQGLRDHVTALIPNSKHSYIHLRIHKLT